MKIALSIPGTGGTPIKIDSGLPEGVPTGGLFGTGQNIIWVAIELFILGAILLSVSYIIRGGINMMSSGGDKEKFQRGRERVRYAIIGLVVIFFSFAMVNIIGTLFGVNLLPLLK